MSQKDHQKNRIKMTGYKLTCPKLHFGQVEHGDIWGSFWSIFLVKKATFSCSEMIFLKKKSPKLPTI